MTEGNIFFGLKVVDLSSFIAGPGAATILSDFGADVVKVEPPEGELWRIGQKIPPQPHSEEPYPFQLANRNKRGVALNLKASSAQQVLERLAKWADVFIVNTPHSARKKLKLEYEDVAKWNPRLIYADLTGFGEKGPDANLPGFDLTAFWARSGLLFMTRDAGEPPTWPVAGSGDNATAVCIYAAIATALYRRERTGKGSYVTTSLLAAGVWSASVFVQAALCGANFYGLHDRTNPANAALNTYRSSDGTWFVVVATPDKVPTVLKAMGREDILTDPRFSDPAKLAQNRPQLTAILDGIFGSQPMSHWYEVFNDVGAIAADGFSDIMIAGAILPSLLHQDPRYFYQGTGSTGSRLRHAVFSTFVARTDQGDWQPNYSGVGGVLASSSLANLYYPRSNRGAGLVFGNFALGIAERIGANVAQEFLLGKFTRRGGHVK